MYGLVNITGIGESAIIEKIAKTIICIDRGCNVFSDFRPVWSREETGGTFIYYLKQINVIVDGCGILKKMDAKIYKYVINSKIYEIIKSLPGYDVGNSYSAKHQHLLKVRRKVSTFQDPLINSSFDIVIYNEPIDLPNIVDNDSGTIVFHNNLVNRPDAFSLTINDLFKVKFLKTSADIQKFQIYEELPNHLYPWYIYEQKETVDLTTVSKILPCVHEKGKLAELDGKKILYPLNYPFSRPFNGTVTIVPVNRTFADIIGEFVDYLSPNDPVLCKEVALTLFACRQNGSEPPANYRITKTIRGLEFKDGDIIVC
jgi:hypothetical protein